MPLPPSDLHTLAGKGCGSWPRLRRSIRRGSAVVCLVMLAAGLLFPALRAAEAVPRPLARAHAHNDYEHPRPLLDALDQGFCSVEADIYLVDGQLLVAHDRVRVKPERTLEALYLAPLQARVEINGGRVHRDGPPFWLLIDFKTEAGPTWEALRPLLERYRPLLTEFRADQTVTNAVTVVLSGNSPRTQLAAAAPRFAAVDGRPEDLETNPSVHLVPWISQSWTQLFTWRGIGEMPVAERERLQGLVDRAHRQGRRVRFWGTADRPELWRLQHEAGVDLINTDKLAELAAWLSGPEGQAGH